jgi:hypothetical protein
MVMGHNPDAGVAPSRTDGFKRGGSRNLVRSSICRLRPWCGERRCHVGNGTTPHPIQRGIRGRRKGVRRARHLDPACWQTSFTFAAPSPAKLDHFVKGVQVATGKPGDRVRFVPDAEGEVSSALNAGRRRRLGWRTHCRKGTQTVRSAMTSDRFGVHVDLRGSALHQCPSAMESRGASGPAPRSKT